MLRVAVWVAPISGVAVGVLAGVAVGTGVSVGKRAGFTSGQARKPKRGMMTQQARSIKIGNQRGMVLSCEYAGVTDADC